MRDAIDQAKVDFTRAKEQLAHAFETTPDDRINWSPAPTARTPVQQVAHCADALRNIHRMLQGQQFAVPNSAEADLSFREWEKRFSTREQVLELLERHSSEYVSWLDTLTTDRLDSSIPLPFGMG